MLGLADIKDWLKTLDMGADRYYVGRLNTKPDKAIGIYSREQGSGKSRIPIGGRKNKTYEEKAVSILIHWNNNSRETEEAAFSLYKKLAAIEGEFDIRETHVKYIRLMTKEPVDVGTDEKGVYERVIWIDFIYEL